MRVWRVSEVRSEEDGGRSEGIGGEGDGRSRVDGTEVVEIKEATERCRS